MDFYDAETNVFVYYHINRRLIFLAPLLKNLMNGKKQL